MATYLVDSGAGEYDATLSGTIIPDETNKVMRFGSDGQADVGFILPSDKEWMLIEVYAVEDVDGHIGYTLFKSRTRNIATDMVTARSVALAEYTTFRITCTHYKGNGTATFYNGDESNALATDTQNTDLPYTPSTSSWKISDDRVGLKNVVGDSKFDDPDDWTIIAGTNVSVTGGALVFSSSETGTNVSADTVTETMVDGAWYTCRWQVANAVEGGHRPILGSTVGTIRYGNGWKSERIQYSTGVYPIRFQGVSATVCTFDILNFTVSRD